MNHTRISEALQALVFEPEAGVELHQVLDRYYAPDYTHRSDGNTLTATSSRWGRTRDRRGDRSSFQTRGRLLSREPFEES